MLKWEYYPVVVGINWGKDGEPVVESINNRRLPEKLRLGASFSQLGTQGWELAGISNGVYIFKRPKS